MRPLGQQQKHVLIVLRTPSAGNSGEWVEDGPWIWRTFSETVRIMESLAARGYVKRTDRGKRRRYVLTEAGWKAADEVHRERYA